MKTYLPFLLGFILISLQGALIIRLLVDRKRLKKVRAELRESESRYRHVIDTQSDLVCRYKRDTTLTFVNKAYCQFFNKSREELIGTKFIDLLPADQHATIEEHIDLIASSDKQIDWEHPVLLPNGNTAWQHWSDLPIFDESGKLIEFQGTGRDISDRKRAEEAQSNLSHALRLAVAGELTAMIAHEVSQPLGAIVANAEAAHMLLDLDNPPLDEIRAILTDIRNADARADQAIKRIRALLKRSEFKLRPLDINTVINETLKLIKGDALVRNVRILSHLTDDLPLIMGDQVHIQQVLLNLILNGMDAMKDVSISNREVVIKTRKLDDDYLAVAVLDKGEGIREENIQSVFTSFFSTKKEGMGLGLAISRSIIEFHQGQIWAERNKEGGSTFQFSLRVA